MKLTKPQKLALSFLATVDYAAPARIGQAMITERYRGQGHSAQGLGRVGGTMASRLVKMGMARDRSREFDYFPRYSITDAGRAALTENIDRVAKRGKQ